MLCIFNTFTSKYFHFAHVIRTMLSSTYHFWGVHNLYQAKYSKLNIGEQSKVGLFFFFRFLFFIYLFSLFVFRFSLFDFVIRFSLLVFHLSYPLFVFLFSFFIFDIQNRAQYRILTFKLRSNILYLHSKSYFDIQTGAEYRILIFKILF